MFKIFIELEFPFVFGKVMVCTCISPRTKDRKLENFSLLLVRITEEYILERIWRVFNQSFQVGFHQMVTGIFNFQLFENKTKQITLHNSLKCKSFFFFFSVG